MFNKKFYIFSKMDAELATKDNLEELILEHYKAMEPLTQYLRKALK